ncbi:class I SAM-dependent methyltransferase [Streptomyces daliensis]|uniref:Methyltransferase domain-containing protein n=1 Tax=Streptomyces daliensis TaxID=299421 RepID=A0A8T4IXE4_9ACTN|nr:methyltransferase domain-containing protein [Streptomyces daliensis]
MAETEAEADGERREHPVPEERTRQHALTLREFARQSETFENSALNGAFTRHLERLADFTGAGPEDVCLDSACGTGIVARALAARTRHVTALDLTPEMLASGKAEADGLGLRNLVFQRGEAERLPFLDGSFTLVVSRYALHHVPEPGRVAAELVRVCRRGSRVVVADMVLDPTAPGEPDLWERLRDPSHGTLLTADRIEELLAAAGGTPERREVFDMPRPLLPWLEQARTPSAAAERITRALEAELAGDGEATGLRPLRVEGALWFTQTLAHVAVTVA